MAYCFQGWTMNRKIEQLKTKLKMAESEYATNVTNVRNELNAEWFKIFEKSPVLKVDFKRLEESNQYGSDESGIYSFIHLTYAIPDDESGKSAFSDYVAEHGYYYQSEHNALLNRQGECIIINEDGDIFLAECGNSKLIIGQDAYIEHSEFNIDLRNELIETWMDKNGYFPGVFREDRHGNIFPVNTHRATKP
jgi:hypothetical protein